MAGLSSIGLEILRFSVPELAVPRACRGVEGQNDKLNDTRIKAIVLLEDTEIIMPIGCA